MRASLVAVIVVFVACDSGSNEALDSADVDTSSPEADADDAVADAGDTIADADPVDTDAGDAADADADETSNDVPSDASTDLSPDVPTADVEADTQEVVEPPRAPAIALTVAAIPAEMNGSRPVRTPTGELPFRLRVNRERVELDVTALPEGGDLDVADLSLVCLADGTPHTLPPPVRLTPRHLQVALDPARAFPDGAAITCTATVANALGTSTSALDFDAATLSPALDPFPSTDLWVVVHHQDAFALDVVELPDGTSDLRSRRVAGGDGLDDLEAPFFELGLMSRADPAATRTIREHLLRRLKGQLFPIYGLDPSGRPTPDGVDLRITFEDDPDAPDPATFGEPGALRFSRIALTGDGSAQDQLGGTFGRALIDWNNQEVEDDTAPGLGVWPAALARTVLRNPLGVLLVADLRPAAGGVPFGAGPHDATFIGKDLAPEDVPDLDDNRHRCELYNLFMEFGSLALASILAHEMGHSLGLVPFGPPPQGLFAGVEADWVVTLAPDAHIDTAGLNVMQTGASVNWFDALAGDRPRFEPLSWAYLRRQLVVGPN